jgi:hypothetical protein
MISRLRLAAAAALTCVLAACGGGSSTVDPFKPTQMVAFGDENSLLTSDGRRYGINGLKEVNSQQVLDCAANEIWTQAVAKAVGLVLAECNPDAKPVTAQLRAQVGSKVADVGTQIDQYLAGGGALNATTLVTILAGQYDIRELYLQFPTQTETQLRAAAGARGRALADQVNRIANASGRVLVLTLPSLGLTPYGLAEKAAHTDTDRAALMDALTDEFNRGLRLQLINDGRLIGLALADESLVQATRLLGLANITQAACAVALPDCSTATLVTDATATTWLWADSLRPSPAFQNLLGTVAVNRLSRLPF